MDYLRTNYRSTAHTTQLTHYRLEALAEKLPRYTNLSFRHILLSQASRIYYPCYSQSQDVSYALLVMLLVILAV